MVLVTETCGYQNIQSGALWPLRGYHRHYRVRLVFSPVLMASVPLLVSWAILFDVLCFPMQSLLHLSEGHLSLISLSKNSLKCWMSQYSYFSFIRNHLLTKWRTWVSLLSLELGCCYTMFGLESVWSVRNTTFSLLCLLFPFHLGSFSIIYWLFIYCRLISNPGPCAFYANALPPELEPPQPTY